jgi:hypothetical protein
VAALGGHASPPQHAKAGRENPEEAEIGAEARIPELNCQVRQERQESGIGNRDPGFGVRAGKPNPQYRKQDEPPGTLGECQMSNGKCQINVQWRNDQWQIPKRKPGDAIQDERGYFISVG